MEKVRISDVTMKQSGISSDLSLSFKDKLELAKLLDRMNVSAIELGGITQPKADSLLIKSIASAVKNSVVSVQVELNRESVKQVWEAVKLAKQPRLQVVAPVSAVQMEYLYHKKPAAMLDAIRDITEACKAVCADVEFIAEDATRSDIEFLHNAINTAIAAGAGTITVCDTAGTMLPSEFGGYINELYASVPALRSVVLGVSCNDSLSLASSCCVAAIRNGAREVKAAAYPIQIAGIRDVATIIHAKGDALGVTGSVRTVEMKRVLEQVNRLCEKRVTRTASAGEVEQDNESLENIVLNSHDDMQAVFDTAEKMGYDLSPEDKVAVWNAFQRIIVRKAEIGTKELDAIIASAAMQVPPTYTVDSFVVNTGNIITAMAHIRLKKGDVILEGVGLGDGPVDAAFTALETILGHHYELDDFQLQSVTEGHEAMGEAVVRLISGGKLYSGRGISTDIIGSTIQAYINALNKIAYEEAEA